MHVRLHIVAKVITFARFFSCSVYRSDLPRYTIMVYITYTHVLKTFAALKIRNTEANEAVYDKYVTISEHLRVQSKNISDHD